MQKAAINISAHGIPYFTPLQDPPAGTSLALPEGKPLPRAFEPITVRGVTFQNRIWVSSMCQYSYEDGVFTDWTLVAIGSYAVRGASLSMIEATAVTPNGRITPNCGGLWKDEQIAPLKRIVDFVHGQNQKIGVQLAHAGRKASTVARWLPGRYAHAGEEKGFPDSVVGPTEEAFAPLFVKPHHIPHDEIRNYIEAFRRAAIRAVEAGVDVVEVHGAHGYLINQFLSSAVNRRTDEYGGPFENRIRLAVEIVKAVKSVLPEEVLLFFRISASDRLEHLPEAHGWSSENTVELAKILKDMGVDVLDVSSGGNSPLGKMVLGPAFQAQLAYNVKEVIPDMVVSSVGAIHEPDVIEDVLSKVDVVFVGRAFAWNPNFVLDLAKKYGIKVKWPNQIGYTC
ncbi:uncharacterized protein V1516DRAFT_446568 [Lipomyces oligophaga]|uniref:uncharacterized protein n=1 Tax=Lipomyces oligophaga TaxID=45792 RepID=UPI0034CD966E